MLAYADDTIIRLSTTLGLIQKLKLYILIACVVRVTGCLFFVLGALFISGPSVCVKVELGIVTGLRLSIQSVTDPIEL